MMNTCKRAQGVANFGAHICVAIVQSEARDHTAPKNLPAQFDIRALPHGAWQGTRQNAQCFQAVEENVLV